jgi:hypothetical protein
MKIGLGILLFLALKAGVAWAEGSAPSAPAVADESCDPDYQAIYQAIRSGETGVEIKPSVKEAITTSMADKSLVDSTAESSVGTEGSAGSGR